jgi:hypothetical protein
MLRVLRGLNRIKAYAEDYGDPVPLIQWAAGRVVRPVRELLTKDAPRQSLSEA